MRTARDASFGDASKPKSSQLQQLRSQKHAGHFHKGCAPRLKALGARISTQKLHCGSFAKCLSAKSLQNPLGLLDIRRALSEGLPNYQLRADAYRTSPETGLAARESKQILGLGRRSRNDLAPKDSMHSYSVTEKGWRTKKCSQMAASNIFQLVGHCHIRAVRSRGNFLQEFADPRQCQV